MTNINDSTEIIIMTIFYFFKLLLLFHGSCAWRKFSLRNISGFKLFLDSIGELPATIDFNRFDRAPGIHNITIIANSTMGEMAEFTTVFFVPGTLCINNLYHNYS